MSEESALLQLLAVTFESSSASLLGCSTDAAAFCCLNGQVCINQLLPRALAS